MKKKQRKSSCLPKFDDEEPYPCELSPSSPEPQNREDQDTILGLISSLHLSSDYSDLTIICKDKIFAAHRLIICPRSKYFHSASYAGFKEAEHPIKLDDKDPTLIEKLLEYLYTGNYSSPLPVPDSRFTRIDGDVPDMDGQPGGESSQVFHAETAATDEPELLFDENSYETVTETLGNIPGKLDQESKMNSELNATDGNTPTYVTENQDEGQMTVPVVDAAVNYHPCYFHLRMYGEADYFMIDDLKGKAEKHFSESFMDLTTTLPFAEIIEEMYSVRANYHGLRQLAIEMIVNNLPRLQKMPTPVFRPELMKSNPDFTYDLFQATLDKYVDGSSGDERSQFHVRFDY